MSLRRPGWLFAGLMILLAVAAFIFAPAIAFAEAPAEVEYSFAWGDFLVGLLTAVEPALYKLLDAGWAWLLAAAAASLPAAVWTIVGPFLTTLRAEQLLKRSAETAIGNIKGAIAGKAATVEIVNAVIRELVASAVRNGSPKVVAFIGATAQSMADKAVARLVEQGLVPANYEAADAIEAARLGLQDAGVTDSGPVLLLPKV